MGIFVSTSLAVTNSLPTLPNTVSKSIIPTTKQSTLATTHALGVRNPLVKSLRANNTINEIGTNNSKPEARYNTTTCH